MEQKSTILFTKKLTEKQKKSLAVPTDDFDFITIKPVDFECHPSPFQTLIFTSQNAVKQVLEKIHIPLQQPIFVVGNKTKKMLLDYADFENIKQPAEEENAKGIIKLIEEQNANDFVYFCGKKRLPTLENYLNENGKKHQVIEVYDTCLTPTLKLDIERYRYICFCSPSAVESFVSAYKLADKQQCICIGQTTAKALRSYTKNVKIAPQSSVESILEMIIKKMGSWGYKLTQSDTFLDVVDTFKTCYHLGDTSAEIEETILAEYAEITNEDSEMQDLVFGIAYGHWHIGTLTEKHFQQMQYIIANDIGMQSWLAQGQESYLKRKKELTAFVAKLKTPRKTILKKRTIKQYMCPFEVGDVLAVQLEDNSYRGILVLTQTGDEPQQRVKFGMQYMVFSAEIFAQKPTKEEILSADILYNTEYGGYLVKNIYAKSLTKKVLKTIQKVGNINIEKAFCQKFTKGGKCFNYGELNEFLEVVNQPKQNVAFKIRDIFEKINTWNEMLINRYDLLGQDIREEIE